MAGTRTAQVASPLEGTRCGASTQGVPRSPSGAATGPRVRSRGPLAFAEKEGKEERKEKNEKGEKRKKGKKEKKKGRSSKTKKRKHD